MLKIPQNNKYKKYNRSTCFKNNKLIRLVDTRSFLFEDSYCFALVSSEKGHLSFVQIKTIFQLILKYTKSKRSFSSALNPLPLDFLKSSVESSVFDTFPFRSKYLFDLKSLFFNKNFMRSLVYNKLFSSLRSNRRFKKKKVLLCVWPSVPITCKSLGIRMGKGKGNVSFWQTPVKRGKILLKIRQDVHPEKALFGLIQVMKRIPFKTKIICKNPLFLH